MVTAALDAFLVPAYGAEGAALATLITEVIVTTLLVRAGASRVASQPSGAHRHSRWPARRWPEPSCSLSFAHPAPAAVVFVSVFFALGGVTTGDLGTVRSLLEAS